MKSVFIVFAILISSPCSWAEPNLKLLSGTEWKGACRKVLSEVGTKIVSKPYSRLQSAYTFEDGDLSWSVKAFKDTKCRDLYETNKYVLRCTVDRSADLAICKQTKWEYSKDGKSWETKPMVDHAGYLNILELKVSAKSLQKKKIQLTAIGESEEPSEEVLSK